MMDDSTVTPISDIVKTENEQEEVASVIETPLILLARQLSNQFELTEQKRGKPLLLEQLKQHEMFITNGYRHFSVAQSDQPLPYAAEWLLDNFFMVQQSIRQIRKDMPIDYYRQLPKLENSEWANLPRAYILATQIIAYSNYQLNMEQVIYFLQAFQANVPLTMGELWAFPTMLRLGILNSLATTLSQYLDDPIGQPAIVGDDTTVRFCITSLRLLATQDWKIFFEQVSVTEQMLRLDPANIYETMDFNTHDRYRKVIENLARLFKHKEEDVASQVILFSQDANPESRQSHVGYYLLDEGYHQLEAWCDYRPSGFFVLRRWMSAHPTFTYLVSIGMITILLSLAFASYATTHGATILQTLLVILLTLLPATAIASSIVNWVVTHKISPVLLPRIDFKDGIPPEYQTMVVIPTLLNDANEIDSLLQQLELHFLRNTDDSLFFALLTDYADAPDQHMPQDEALISRIQIGIDALNAKYHQDKSPFYLFHRERQWNASQNAWMGWERKRGKLMEFNHLLRGNTETTYTVQIGDMRVLPNIKYVITLDADTILPEGSARQLVGILAHPLNRAEYDTETGKVVSGYSILQPRIDIKPTSINQSRFSWIFAGDVGIDLYTHAVSDVYQDLFGEGSYVGKGIYDVDMLEACLVNRIPENTLLSHDLFEGIHARVALVSDIVMLEEYPAQYLGYTRRMHRWIRGDWQLLPWLFPKILTDSAGNSIPNTFSTLDRWKIFDNLRRSLVTPALLMLLMTTWIGFIGEPLFWTLMTLIILGFSLIISLLNNLRDQLPTKSALSIVNSSRPDALRWLFALIFLPYEALLALNAIGTTLVRLFITHTRMLQWATAAQTAQHFKTTHGSESTWREMSIAPIFALILGVLIALVNISALPIALPFLIAWFISPQVAYWLSSSAKHTTIPLSDVQTASLRHLARQTWLFFEQTVGPQDHWLPPDHFQDSPRLTAHRTSPTNIGLLLISTLSAYDLGYIGLLDLSTRLQATLDTLDQLDHYRGHLLNWYDTETLMPLAPRYVSTVDSGNLAGCLVVVEQACIAFPHALVIRPQRWQGLLDTLGLLEESLNSLYSSRVDESVVSLKDFVTLLRKRIEATVHLPILWAIRLATLNGADWEELSHRIVAVFESGIASLNAENLVALRITSERFHHHLTSMKRDIAFFMPWLLPFSNPPALFVHAPAHSPLASAWEDLLFVMPLSPPKLGDLISICETLTEYINQLRAHLPIKDDSLTQMQEAINWCDQLQENLNKTHMQVSASLSDYQSLATRIETRFQVMDFSFLFNTQRKVFHIGYNVTNDKLDDNFYDLLASEARLASFLAIAKREVTPSHWVHLGRPITQVKNSLTLLSWSGTMFEYLMPTLFMKSYEQTFLTQSCYTAVKSQIAYGLSQNVPWGISESSYYAFDGTLTYQYHAFGVPELGFKRDSRDDLVIAPYASLLALGLYPQAVYGNMKHLDKINMRGLFGFYEAVDYTPSRVPLRQDYAIVQSYMAHHQGMILTSLTNYLLEDVMIQRFHADLRVQSFSMLLQEKIPTQAPIEDPHPLEMIERVKPSVQVNIAPWQMQEDTTVPQVHTLSNGRLTTLITQSGSGYSQWKGLSLTRWEADTTLDASGLWIYVQDKQQNKVWSAGYQPTTIPQDYQHVVFYPHQVEFQRRDYDITINMQVLITADDDVEIRQVTLINHSDEVRYLRVTSYGEVLLAPQSERHLAFNKLFIESEYIAQNNLLLFQRRLRGDEEPIFWGHLLITSPNIVTTGDYEGDRNRFLGRGHTIKSPAILVKGGNLSKTIGTTLDPIMALGQDIELEPYGRVSIAYLTIVTRSREQTIALAEQYQDWAMLERAVELSRRQNEQALQQLEMGTPALAQMQQVLSLLLYPHIGLRASADVIRANTKSQSALWSYGISGDMPILLIRIGDVAELPLVLEILRAHTYWRDHQLSIDLVILNLHDSTYSQELHEQVHRQITQANSGMWLNRRGGIFVINADQMAQGDQILLETVARVILDGNKGLVGEQLPRLSAHRTSLPSFRPSLTNGDVPMIMPLLPRPTDLQFDNGTGGFSADGKEYVIYLEAGQHTPAPWVNVIANEQFGFLISESGAGYTWAGNSSENRLTPWRNDPVSDIPSEALYIRDEETAQVWSPTPSPSRDSEPYLIRHGAGYSQFEHYSRGLKQKTLMFVAPDAPIKIIKLHLENTWNRPRRVTVTYYAEWVLGVNRGTSQTYIVPEYDHASKSLLAHNHYNVEFGDRVAFLAGNKAPHGLTTDRTEFLGRMGDISRPMALNRVGLTSIFEAGLDPCAVIQLHIDLPIGGSEEVFFLLGQGQNREDALRLIQTYQNAEQVEATWGAVTQLWNQILGAVSIETPNIAMNILLNRWMLYQSLSCRIWGRSGFYQSGGAYGFRDQLQDVMAFLLTAPNIARDHILRAAHHQFEAGDVLHWWHPPNGRGVRTRCSDDLLWLPFVVAQYIETTGDEAILDERVPFLRGEPLKMGEDERYGLYETTTETYSLYEHCLRAIKRGSTTGIHGLPLMGAGDWNDGMNRVGIEGRGESVWLGWFLYSILTQFTPICQRRLDSDQADLYIQQANLLKSVLEATGWDGKWYRRAYYDNGTPLGTAQGLECQIDSIAQSWAVISGAGDPSHAQQAMSAIQEYLVRPDDQLLLLFTPPFDKTDLDPGYIKSYPPGIRENGGQYTHAALWAVWAFAELGRGNLSGELFELLNPISHTDTPEKIEKYRVEPYVIAADVYSVPPHNGRGGWTWYTGSASWMYRLGIEQLLGLKRKGNRLEFAPCIPPDWTKYTITYRYDETVYTIHIHNPRRVHGGIAQMRLDGNIVSENYILLQNDGLPHEVHIELGKLGDR